ncbi:pyruvate, phosphate dikinase [Eilatimonas milleporae]|uniref:Pyruvate,orthophosphate dikinase n=1 Tax=Eilatimonas milleporae TaxID=911205 RepID=A0A3M0CHZ8_9PROT|nr:pyruvate, phosphate dikinase [Eilatimonas milleporae]RMB08130.1 pyruvate,orthophosphate dikinase [Eilatimonas milleporae]
MIYPFDHPHDGGHDAVAKLVGGKGASLWAMTSKLNLPVPPGFTIATDECHRFLENGMTARLQSNVRAALKGVEAAVGRRFGDAQTPLLLSVRSGAPVSMPGMMDTVLNVGLTDATVEGLANVTGDRTFALDSYRRFLAMFARTVLGLAAPAAVTEADGTDTAALEADIAALKHIIAGATDAAILDDPYALLDACIGAVFRSWHSPRADHYREVEGIDERLGTAATVQAMVFGNQDTHSATGVVFTRDPSTGAPGLCGDILFNAQGEDVVSGTHRTLPLEALADRMPAVWADLETAAATLERYYRDLCDIEFTVESGRLWVLQARRGKRSPAAAVRIAVDLVEDPTIALPKNEALTRIPADAWDGAHGHGAAGDSHLLAMGTPASPGVATGMIVLSADEAVDIAADGEDIILVRRETSPEDVHGMGAAKGILTSLGGMMSHAAVVARGWGVPAVVGVETLEIGADRITLGETVLKAGETLSIDGSSGKVFAGAITATRQADPYLDKARGWARDLGHPAGG